MAREDSGYTCGQVMASPLHRLIVSSPLISSSRHLTSPSHLIAPAGSASSSHLIISSSHHLISSSHLTCAQCLKRNFACARAATEEAKYDDFGVEVTASSSHLISPHLTAPHLTSPHRISPHRRAPAGLRLHLLPAHRLAFLRGRDRPLPPARLLLLDGAALPLVAPQRPRALLKTARPLRLGRPASARTSSSRRSPRRT
jgi:hypothetical protein